MTFCVIAALSHSPRARPRCAGATAVFAHMDRQLHPAGRAGTMDSLTSKTASSPHGCPGPSTSLTNLRAPRARSARPASVTLSRTATLAIAAPALSRPPHPRETSRTAGGRRNMHAQLRRERQAGATHPPRTSSVAPSVIETPVRGRPCNADGPHTAPRPRFSSAMRPWTPQQDCLQRDTMTHCGTRRKRPAGSRFRSQRAVSPGCGRCWVRTNVG